MRSFGPSQRRKSLTRAGLLVANRPSRSRQAGGDTSRFDGQDRQLVRSDVESSHTSAVRSPATAMIPTYIGGRERHRTLDRRHAISFNTALEDGGAVIRLDRALLVGDETSPVTDSRVRRALAHAVELEHATIPVYLYAAYSLDPDVNGEVRRILRQTVVEEMLHMVLAANVLTALGGRPSINRVDFVPKYPGRLPGGVEGQVVARLRPLSLEQLRVLIEIEEPRDPLAASAQGPLDIGACTIGEFYEAIEDALRRLPPSVFVGDPSHQVGPDLMWGSVAVTDHDSALRALGTIVDQGEGSRERPAADGGDLAHYYRLLQVHEGRRLVTAEDATSFRFAGDPLVLDPSGVYPLPDDPSVHDHAEGSEERTVLERFNLAYRQLLGTLEHLLTGHADEPTFTASLAQMRRLDHLAEELVARGLGPTFEVERHFH